MDDNNFSFIAAASFQSSSSITILASKKIPEVGNKFIKIFYRKAINQRNKNFIIVLAIQNHKKANCLGNANIILN